MASPFLGFIACGVSKFLGLDDWCRFYVSSPNVTLNCFLSIVEGQGLFTNDMIRQIGSFCRYRPFLFLPVLSLPKYGVSLASPFLGFMLFMAV